MNVLLPSGLEANDHGDLGSWHPAFRPDSNIKGDLSKSTRNTEGAAESILDPNKPSASLSIVSSSHSQPGPSPIETALSGDPKRVFEGTDTDDNAVTLRVSDDLLERDDEGKTEKHTRASSFGEDAKVVTPTDNDGYHVESFHHQQAGLADDELLRNDSASPIAMDLERVLPESSQHGKFSSDIPWDNEFQLDPAWGLRQDHTGVPNGVPLINRTNSFPDVPPLHQSTSLQSTSLTPHLKSDDVSEDVQNSRSVSVDSIRGHTDHSFPEDQERVQDSFRFAPIRDEVNFFADMTGLEGGVLPSPADEEARFEEGIPLVPSESNHGWLAASEDATQGSTINSSGAEDANHNANFFDQVTATSPADVDFSFFRPQHLDRKSTNQVLDSLHFAPHSTVHTLPHDSEEQLSTDESRGNSNMPSTIPASTGIVRDDQLTRASNEFSSPPNLGTYSSSVSSNDVIQPADDEDLAAMWKAALGDDELLDEIEASQDPSSFFEDDGEGLLDENELIQQASPPVWQSKNTPESSIQGINGISVQAKPEDIPKNNYLPASSSVAPNLQQYAANSLTHSVSAPLGFRNPPGRQSLEANVPPQLRPSLPQKAQSFADKSKGGYKSPYDIPMDVSRPKKRSTLHQMQSGSTSRAVSGPPPPPPRTSSMLSNGSSSQGHPIPNPIMSDTSRPSVSPPMISPNTPSFVDASSLKSKPTTGTFFEELPFLTKPRPSSSAGRFTPQAPLSVPPPQTSPYSEQIRRNDSPQQPSSSSIDPSQGYQLLPPERVNPYAIPQSEDTARNSVPAINSRYSPAPQAQTRPPPGRNRYTASPSSVARPPQQSTSLSFQPRTSSPLAQSATAPPQYRESYNQGRLPEQSPYNHQQGPTTHGFDPPSSPVDPYASVVSARGDPLDGGNGTVTSSSISEIARTAPLDYGDQYVHTSNLNSRPSYTEDSTIGRSQPIRSSSHYHPHERSQSLSDDPGLNLPKRPKTQSPSSVRSRPELNAAIVEPYQRPASVNDPTSPTAVTQSHSMANLPANGRKRGFSQGLNYIRPSDGRENDPLERWKGCPIFTFGFGGQVITSFPKQIPRYGTGQAIPMIKCSPGEVRLYPGKILPLEEGIATFPGPLNSKSKKKEVLVWFEKRIFQLEETQIQIPSSPTIPDSRKCHKEKVLLWKLLQVLVHYDGIVEGNPLAEKAVRTILSPESAVDESETTLADDSRSQLVGISRPSGFRDSSEPTNPEAVESLRKFLLHGEREKAVWHAVDRRLWAHAMIIASTLPKDVGKRVVQEFVRQEVKTFGNNTESLAALYEIFAGNWEESIDELVPPSARAGLQMVSKVAGAGPTKNALEGLDRWRETLTLILSNRSPDDGRALVALGQLLLSYGRTEAAHICFVFAKSPGLFGGPDEPQVNVVLLGANHRQHPFDYSRDFDGVLLTEVYDFALTVLAPSAVVTVSPHLQAYKLYHAMVLAEYGYRFEAQQYCDAITSAMKSTTKLSPYYHGQLFGALDDLVNRLRQAPKEGSSSWMSKPSMNKVSGSVWARFNQFVVGDDSDSASMGSGKGLDNEAGPFAKVTGDTPSISRTPSTADLYGQSLGAGLPPSLPSATGSNSRHAPAGQYTPRSSLEIPGRSSQEFQRPTQFELSKAPLLQRQPSNQSTSYSPPNSYQSSNLNAYQPTSQPSHAPAAETYLPTPPSPPVYIPVAPPEDISSSLYHDDSYRPTHPSEPTRQEAYLSPHESESRPYEPQSSSYAAPTGYEPPSIDAPSYNPEIDYKDQSPVQEKPKKKSFMDDDDDDFTARAAALLKKDKSQNDRDADDAFRKAAEVDGKLLHAFTPLYPANISKAQKDKAPASKKSWFGGWLGGGANKNDLNAPAPAAGPIRAKLGEESSFFYDSDLKKWVNKKGGATTPGASAASAPPPKGPPSRTPSGFGGPPQPLATSTPPINSSRPPISSHLTSHPLSTLPPSSDPPSSPALSASPGLPDNLPPTLAPPSTTTSAPTSRPSTAMSGAGSIDDLIGVPQARKGGTVRKGKKGRGYVDVMAK
ncbi:vesicle coat component [Toensbergia leucococca]|nr:vesicle coat component [Toensbergia leucococca]